MNFYSLWNCIFYNAGSSITREAFSRLVGGTTSFVPNLVWACTSKMAIFSVLGVHTSSLVVHN